MEKSITTDEYRILLTVLRRFRKEAGLTQIDLAEKLNITQSQLSKVERGDVRWDVIQLRAFCAATGTDLVTFSTALEAAINDGRVKTVGGRRRSTH